MMETVSTDDGVEEEDSPSAFSSLPTNETSVDFAPADLLGRADAGVQLPTRLIFDGA